MDNVNEIILKDWYSWTTGLEVTLDDKTVNIAKGTYANTRNEVTTDPTSLDPLSIELKPDDTYLTTYGVFVVLEEGVVKYATSRDVQFAGDISSSYRGSGMLLLDLVQACITVDGDIKVEVKHVKKVDPPPPDESTIPPLSSPPWSLDKQKGDDK